MAALQQLSLVPEPPCDGIVPTTPGVAACCPDGRCRNSQGLGHAEDHLGVQALSHFHAARSDVNRAVHIRCQVRAHQVVAGWHTHLRGRNGDALLRPPVGLIVRPPRKPFLTLYWEDS